MPFERYSREHLDGYLAKAANAAEVCRRSTMLGAKAELKQADHGKSDAVSDGSAGNEQRETAPTPDFSGVSNSSDMASKDIDTSSRLSGDVTRWAEKVAALSPDLPPKTYPERAWRHFLADAKRFIELWAEKALDLEWSALDIWGVDSQSPWHRLEALGLVPALNGDRIESLTSHEAIMCRPSGARLTYRRRTEIELARMKRSLIWDLAR